MYELVPLTPVDYLVIGHLARDLTPEGPRLGGTAAYAALTARALGLRVGVLTACPTDISLEGLEGITIVALPSQHCTTFENIPCDHGRRQILHQRAEPLSFESVPEEWRKASIIHLGPIAQEVDSHLPAGFSPTLLGLTPQGWLRSWNGNGRVHPSDWPDFRLALRQAGAAVLSLEDVDGDERLIESLALACRVLVVTEGPAGARLYWNGDMRHFPAPKMDELDSTGAGDVFAAAFFIRLYFTRDPWEAARFATRLASLSVGRAGLASVPTTEEIQNSLVEVL
jgi:sugar/nucleoside kinase (ribokinase family)